jgi:hypothetical protein
VELVEICVGLAAMELVVVNIGCFLITFLGLISISLNQVVVQVIPGLFALTSIIEFI